MKDYQQSPFLNMIQGGAQNRLATVFFYLNNVTKGGETAFPMAGHLPVPRDYGDCTSGVQVAAEADKVIIFYSLLPSGEPDFDSLHGGCRVQEGEKWSANFW